ncbi:MAG TPA: formate dehydrogenase-N subunit alpha [Candidatus Binataceae bacterium]|nr:formate dehydrogenase-N subunit alpha [Candidatus Binataceae bacterium]
MPGLGASFGRGAATTFQADLATSDCILIMGSNMAEAHPVGFRFALQARERGGTLIHVDPRFTRTSAMVNTFVSIRAGSDIAFLGGIINYIIEHDRWFKEYVLHFTNAATVLNEAFVDAEDAGGIFPGFDADARAYVKDHGSWNYSTTPGEMGAVERDPSLQHPRCVFQVMRRHYARYTPEMVSRLCGCAPGDLIRVAELLCRNSGRERTSAIVYALGWTQHTTGVQMIRAAGIIQLLLGNMGRPGGGIMAMRGHCSIQGSTDVPTLYNLLPGYLSLPDAVPENASLEKYIEHGRGFANARNNSAAGFWQEEAFLGYWANLSKFTISLLKAWYGDAATPANEFGYQYLPKIDGDYSELPMFFRMHQGKVKGLFLIGQNPAAGAPNAGLNRSALRSLDWLVVRDWFEHESANFWYADSSAPDSRQIKTEVFFLPAASITEKDGSFTNTERMLQWHEKAIDPPGDCRSDAFFMYDLGRRLKKLYADSNLERDLPIKNLTWDFGRDAPEILPNGAPSRLGDDVDAEKILKEMNGRDLREGRLLKGIAELKDNGSTACGVWIYSGVFPAEDQNRANSRDNTRTGILYPNWGFAWPSNRRTLYNRASADAQGRPWSERKKLIWWDADRRTWTGFDVPDFEIDKAPSYRPPAGARGMDAIPGDAPFIMHPDGLGWLFAPFGVRDGPLPTHYEPRESVVRNLLYTTQVIPTIREFPDELNRLAEEVDPEFPIVATTYRLTEHYLSGPMSRFNSWLNELQPEMFAELSPELAAEKGIENGGWVVISSRRGSIEARALVTARMKPLLVNGKTIYQLGLPIHWGYAGETVGAMANDLTSLILGVNVSMHEAKAFTVAVRPGRLTSMRAPRPIAANERPFGVEPIPDTASSAQPEGRQQWWGWWRSR